MNFLDAIVRSWHAASEYLVRLMMPLFHLLHHILKWTILPFLCNRRVGAIVLEESGDLETGAPTPRVTIDTSLLPRSEDDPHSSSAAPSPSPSRFSANMKERRALLIACSYLKHESGEYGPLKNSWKDVRNMKRLLLASGWEENEITMLYEGDCEEDSSRVPTRENIVKHLKALTMWAKKDDLIFVHFSGHGYQKEAYFDQFEADLMDEFILPCDFWRLRAMGKPWYILDDELRRILVDELVIGTRLIAVFDACSSATILDLPIEHVSKDLETAGQALARKFPVSRGRLEGYPPERSSTLPCFGVPDVSQKTRPARPRPTFLPRRATSSSHNGRCRKIDTRPEDPPVVDDRVIKGQVICIASCADNASTFETPDGGVMVSHFCKVMNDALLTPDKAITLRELDTALNTRMMQAHDQAKEEAKKANSHWNDNWRAPVPHFCFSHKMDMDNTQLTLSR